MDQELKNAYDAVFNTVNGKKVLEDLATISHFDSTHITADAPHMSHFYEGQRSLFCYILSGFLDDNQRATDVAKEMKEQRSARRREMLKGIR